ncbi:right-handed parallel beta-helix repeat-containing protein [Kribbella speibonae]|uniref:Right-handed parallel beta-helix repeat-containing protein n=1 Tax=Kribbella speibonae TaxID=1572660 RepID=A0A4V2M543_9ACTN|nr:right-handed parallel beta-helix repeat-containing protein [Kribbella speibonae]TCC23692.1 right-handed parallel beta-helix repeat-containing protein [Kribbella speibonae]TCC38262.1 right-handed parallel beta-helix repeat-containing protein [Kribbella speibonae]
MPPEGNALDTGAPPPPSARTAWSRRRLLLGVVVLVLAALTAVGVFVLGDDPAAKNAPPPATGSPAITNAPVTAPTAPPARICGNTKVLFGPATAPAGAVVVRTTDNVNQLTEANPPGTTFWLSPGTHRLGSGPFAQVIPKDGNTYVGAPGAILDGGRRNRYAFTGYATAVTLKNLTIQNFGPVRTNNDEGVVNHDAAGRWTLTGNTIKDNAGAGVMVGDHNVVRSNCLQNNGQYGFNAYNPGKVSGITIEGNEIAGNNTDDWERLKGGCGCTGGGKFWEVTGAIVRNNWVHDNHSAGLWADTNNTGFVIEGNYISGNLAEGLVYETSYNAGIRGNAFVRNGLGKGPANDGFPTPALYISESGSDPRAPGVFNQTFEISRNVFTDNWAGVILWENADRFAGSAANTSTGSGTLVNPSVVTAKTCNATTIRDQPYLSDCRWKTQNVRVHDNVFNLNPAKVSANCGSSSGCGYNGLFSNWGTFPAWSPYQKATVQDAITFHQGNRFFNNTYSGPWNFIVHEQGNRVNWASWQGAPYGQDQDSVVKVLGER